jgi:hypothetical protein
MKRLMVPFVLICGLLVPAVLLALGPAPSWVLTQGAANSCSGTDIFLPGVQINAPSPASERGTLTAPGQSNLGFTTDTNFTGVGTFGFTVFTGGPYTVPPNTWLTLSVTTFNGPNFTGGPAYISEITWNCTTGAVIPNPNGVAVPALSEAMLAALALAFAALGAVLLYRKRSASV